MSVVRDKKESSGELPFACDLVMKGGLTSGIVYPAAIVELARDHRFHNIGGASAGAIAAVGAAAAEYGRQTGGGGFDVLASIPDELAAIDPESGQTALQRLFVPQPSTAEYFDLFWEQKSFEGSVMQRLRSVLPHLLRHGPLIPDSKLALVGAAGLPLAALIWLVLAPSPGTIAFFVLGLAVGAAVYVTSRAVSGTRHMAQDVQQAVGANRHGLCNGSSEDDQIGLTEWLHNRIEALAGPHRHARGREPDVEPRPLTYGDLGQHQIGLVTLTTNLSQSSSENFPFSDDIWAFDPADIKALFPADVAEYLVRRGQAATEQSESQRSQLTEQGLLKLPPPDELPVVLGARVSLSFPVVISAVPLWQLVPVRQPGRWITRYEKVWLSDGGICSNLPVHLFDTPLPTRPTYGINLGSGADPDAAASDNVWRPIRAASGQSAPISPIGSTAELLAEVLNTMQNWSDDSMTKALGVRDRICTIQLGKGEGGLHLDMSADTIRGLVPRGRVAGENLGWMMRGDPPAGTRANLRPDRAATQWTRHRWTRLRSVALAVGGFADKVRRGWTSPAVPQGGPHANALSYEELATTARQLLFLPYRSKWTDQAGHDLTDAIEALTLLDFGVANSRSKPPKRELVLSARSTPETELQRPNTSR